MFNIEIYTFYSPSVINPMHGHPVPASLGSTSSLKNNIALCLLVGMVTRMFVQKRLVAVQRLLIKKCGNLLRTLSRQPKHCTNISRFVCTECMCLCAHVCTYVLLCVHNSPLHPYVDGIECKLRHIKYSRNIYLYQIEKSNCRNYY